MESPTLKKEKRSQQLVFDILPKTSVDLAGFEFEKLLDKVTRKKTGQYYTPRSIVNYIIENLSISKKSKILDPTCGCGSFLMGLYDRYQHFGSDFLKNLYGVDLNAEAINLTRDCLSIKAGKSQYIDSILATNLKVGNSLVDNKLISSYSFSWRKEFDKVFTNGGFDFIIGNPPYVTLHKNKDFDPCDPIYSQLIDGPVNAASLMIGRAMDLLRYGGTLAFLLPKSILYVDSYSRLRKFLAMNYMIEEIFDLGMSFQDVRGEQTILFIRKSKPLKNHKIRIKVSKTRNMNMLSIKTINIPQSEYVKYDKWLTFSNMDDYLVINKLKKNKQTLDFITNGKIFRGIPVSANKTSSCPENSKSVIRGRDIKKFHINQKQFLSERILKTQSVLKIKDLSSAKIVVQNIFSSEAGLIADFDEKAQLSLDTVTNIIISNEQWGLFVLGLLSSKLLNYFLTFALFNRSRLTMHVDKSYVGQLPIIIPADKKIIDDVIKKAKEIRSINDVKLQKAKMRELDCIVYKIYSLSNEEIKVIEDSMSEILSKKSVW